ncbi:MAG TPA: ThuA domain-containing protein, partial [Chthoniobacteraceae bacterium]
APILEPATRLAAGIAVRGDGAELQRLVTLIALSEGADPKLVSALLTSTASSIKAGTSPAWTAELQQAFGKLLQGEAGASALPLVVAWDKQGTLAPQVKALSDLLVTNLQDPAASDDQRIAALTTLLATGRNVQPSITAMLASPERLELRQRVLAALGDSPDAANGALIMQVFPKLEPALQNTALTQLLKRPEWTHALIAGIREKSVAMQTLGAIGLDRLRNHPDKAIAKEAQEAIQAVMGPQIAEKNKIIAQFLPQVELGGDVVNGKAMFTAACAVCHKFNGEGNPVGPELTGMGAHPRAELLTHIVDPNREVDPSFAAWSVELKDGNAYVGVITRENAQSVTIRDQAAEHDVPKATVARLTAMGRSLMPEGLEALGAGALRDILAYLETGGGRFRIIDMSPAATADGRLGLFSSKEALSDNLEFKKYGSLQIGDVPFRVSDPAQSATGKNLVVLKGGSGFAKTHPQKVEIAVPKVQANALHFLGGVAGWGFPWGSADRTNAPAARVTIAYAGGKSEMLELKNGVEFADYMGHADVPGSVAAPLVDNHKQVRVFRKPLQIGGAIEKITIESADNFLAPVFAAITAEQANAGSPPANQSTSTSVVATPAAAAPAPSTAAASNSPQAPTTASGVRALIVGGGSSHDFAKWFGDVDKNTLSALQPAWIHYTENVNNLALILANIDVLVWSANQSLSNETRAALMEFVAAGKGLIVLHPGIWYNWNNFPQWNKEIIGGGSRGHDKYGDFDVELLEPNHPLLVGVPPTFRLADELYHSQLDPAGAATTVLAQSTSPASGKTFPQVWTVAHPKSRIICITLGHDGPAHNHPAYQTLLKNAFLWAAKR